MSTALEVTGFFMCVVSWLVTGVSVANDYWKFSSLSGSVIISNRQYENLWHACAEDSSGVSECRDIQSMLSLPVHIQVCRALMIIALIFGLVSIIVTTMGLKCIHIGQMKDEPKSKIAVSGGILFILAGLCTMVAISLYAAWVVQEFNDPFYGGIKFELGSGLYIGWACLYWVVHSCAVPLKESLEQNLKGHTIQVVSQRPSIHQLLNLT